MIVVIEGGPKAEINALLDQEKAEWGICLAIRKHPRDPSKFDFVAGQRAGRLDASPVGLPIFIDPDVNKPGVYRLTRSGKIINLTKEP